MKVPLRIGWQMIVYHIIAMVLSLLFVSMLGSMLWLQIVLSLMLLLAYGWMLYSDGCARGERAVTLSVQLDRLRSEGRELDPALEAERFRKSTIWKGYAIGVLPLVLIALANIVAEPLYPPFQPMTEEEMALIEQNMELAQQQLAMPDVEPDGEAAPAPAEEAAPAEAPEQEPVRINPFNVAARVAFTPYVFLYTPLQHRAVLLNWLFLLCALLVPLAEPAGYLQGPALRKKKLEMIEKGKKRKMRNLKVNKKPRQPRKPKMEV